MKPYYDHAGIQIWHRDCMALMADTADKAFDLAIVDPPYGIGASSKSKYHAGALTEYDPKKWDSLPPSAEYFKELFRISKEQIIWGSNYFTSHLPPRKNWIVWDKLQPEGISLSMHELAFYSGDGQAKIYRGYNGANRVANNDDKAQKYIRIHPTQKPVQLYGWLLTNYARQGMRILDTHLGSGSIAIACLEFGCPLVACEIDADYIAGAVNRIEKHSQQEVLSL